MFAAIFFLSFVTLTLALRGDGAALPGVLALSAFIFFLRKKSAADQLKNFYLLVLLTTAGGCIFSLLRFPEELHELPKIIKSQTAKVTNIAARSAIIELTENKMKLRLSSLPINHGLVRSDLIELRCRPFVPPENLFQRLERLQGISAMCANESFKVLNQRSPVSAFFLSIRGRISNNLENALPANSLARGVLLADTASIDPYELSLYRHMGIAHLFAASGLHMGFIFGLFFLPFRLINRRIPGLIIGFAASTFFLFLLEAPVSLVRAYIFLLFFLLRELSDRQVSKEAILFLTAILTELLYPLSTFSVSFILSFGVTGSIILFFSDLRRLFAPIKFKPLADHLALTIAAFAASAPLSAFFFDSSGPASLLYNFLAVPLAALYLMATLTVSLVPAAAPAVMAGDYFYQKLAHLHSQTIYAYLPPIPEMWAGLWGCGVLFLLLIFWYRVHHASFWVAKNIPLYGLPLFLAAFYFPLFFGAPLPNATRAVPGMVLEYDNRKIYSSGRPAPFLEQNFANIFSLPPWPVRQIHLPPEWIIMLPELLQSKAVPISQSESVNGLLRGHFGCYLFFYSMRAERWRPDELTDCQQLFLVLSKKDRESLTADLTPLARNFRYNKEITPLVYFTWQEISANPSK